MRILFRIHVHTLVLAFAAAASSAAVPQLRDGPVTHTTEDEGQNPDVYGELGRSFAGVRLGTERPIHALAAGVVRTEPSISERLPRRYRGVVVVLVPRSPTVVMELTDAERLESFGECLASHDSTLLIGAAGSLEGRGRVRIVDVNEPESAHWLDGFEGARGFGATLLTVPGDRGDGYRALISGLRTPGADGAKGAVALYFDAHCTPTWIARAAVGEVEFGLTLAALGDVDGDGEREFAVSSQRGARGAVSLLSGKDGRRLREWVGDADGDGFGTGLSGIPDLDGDGRGDLAIGVPWRRCEEGFAGVVLLVSSATGKTLRVLESDCAKRGQAGSDPRFGYTLLSLGFESGIAPSLVVGEPGGFYNGSGTGRISGWTLTSSNRTEVGEPFAWLGWRYSGFRPDGFGTTLAICTLDLAPPQPVLVIGGGGQFGGGLHVQALLADGCLPSSFGKDPLWEVFGCNLRPPE